MIKNYAIVMLLLCVFTNIKAQTTTSKPNIWIHTDFTGALSYSVSGDVAKAVTDGGSDPDDHVAMAMYLMMANKFNTKKIVLGSSTSKNEKQSDVLFNESFGKAYQSDLTCLNANIGGYPTELSVIESSLTATTSPVSYVSSPDNKYDSYNNLLPSVKLLVDELKKPEYTPENPLYVLVWGPMTEIAMVTKHLIRNNETAALNRLFVVSHWTSSFLNQVDTPCSAFPSNQTQFKPANCNQNCEACAYMHNEAKKTGAPFKFVDLGSVGQEGVVNGSSSFFTGGNGGVGGPQYVNFQKSKLGDLFVKSKFGWGKPDGSDCATFLAVLGTYGVKLSDYNNNGVLTKTHEENAAAKFKTAAPGLMQDLTNISNKVASGCTSSTSPTVSITAPANNASFTAPATVNITANASDADGTISNVKFYNGTTLLNTDNTAPYSFSWTSVAAGTYSITAVATDNSNKSTTSTAVSITVGNSNASPSVSITAPANNASFTAPATVNITANAADTDGSIANVKFYNGTTLLNTDNTSPYSFSWTSVAAGTYSITAVATDNGGLSTTSTAVSITVSGPIPTNINDLSLNAIACKKVELNWSDVNGEDGYRIRRKLPSDANFSTVADVAANVTKYTDSTLSENTSYLYMVRPLVAGQAVAVSNTPEVRTPLCVVTSTEDMEGIESLHVQPNPFEASFTFIISEEITTEKVILYDLLGVAQYVNILNIGQNMYNVETSNLPNGQYLLKIETNKGVITSKVNKM
jgi:hypothetical protein